MIKGMDNLFELQWDMEAYGGLWKLLMVVSLWVQMGVWEEDSNESVERFKICVVAESFLEKGMTIVMCDCVKVEGEC